MGQLPTSTHRYVSSATQITLTVWKYLSRIRVPKAYAIISVDLSASGGENGGTVDASGEPGIFRFVFFAD